MSSLVEEEQGQLWGGRFEGSLDRAAAQLNASLPVDVRLYRHDIQGSLAHAAMLAQQGLISEQEGQALERGLKELQAELESLLGDPLTWPFDPPQPLPPPLDGGYEDIHTAVEMILKQRLGRAAARLHTGRSRNDQVALDLRLFVREASKRLRQQLTQLRLLLLDQAGEHLDDLLPGYTHLQRAQPVTLAHYLLAYEQMLRRDARRLEQVMESAAVSPLGAAALAGSGLPLDPQAPATALGLPKLAANSLDAVSDRDFALEFVFTCAAAMTHLSRWCEELVLWSTTEFGFVRFADAFSTGSSIMPQKKNPDLAELIRGRAARTSGRLATLFTLLKGLPLAYNKDMQEDKEPVFDAYDTLSSSLAVLQGALATIEYRTDRMAAAAGGGFSTATEIADLLVERGLPFREAHAVVGKIVLYCEERDLELTELPTAQWHSFHELLDEAAAERVKPASAVNRHQQLGGPAAAQVRQLIERERADLAADHD